MINTDHNSYHLLALKLFLRWLKRRESRYK